MSNKNHNYHLVVLDSSNDKIDYIAESLVTQTINASLKPGYKSCIDFLNHIANEDKPKITISVFLPFRSLIEISDYKNKINIKEWSQTPKSKFSIELNQYSKNNLEHKIYFNRSRDKLTDKRERDETSSSAIESKSGLPDVDLIINLIFDFKSLEKMINQKNQSYVIIPVLYGIPASTLMHGLEETLNDESEIVFNTLSPKIVYATLPAARKPWWNQISFFDKNYFLLTRNWFTTGSGKKNGYNFGFQEDYLVFFKNTKDQSFIPSEMFIDYYGFRYKNNQNQDSKEVLSKKNTFHSYIHNMDETFEYLEHLLPERFIDEKITNISYWYHCYKKCGNNTFLMDHIKMMLYSFFWLFFVVSMFQRASYFTSAGYYLAYVLFIVLPQILKFDLFTPKKTITLQENIFIRQYENTKITFDWKFIIIHYLFPLNRIGIVLMSLFIILFYLLKRI